MATKSSKGRSGSRSGGSSSRSGKSGKSGSGSSGGGSRKGSSSSRGQSSTRSGKSSSNSSGGSQRRKLPATAQKVVGTVKKHPITTAAIGAGVAIAAVAGVRKAMSARAASQQDDVDETEGAEDEEDEDSDDEEDDGDASSEADSGDEDDESDAEDSQDETSGRWSTRLSSALGGGASSVGRAARSSMARGRETARETWENHALALAAGALVAGTALGLLLPATEPESRLMGKWSDRFAGPAKEMGGQLLGQGKRIVGNVLSEGYNATQEEAEKVGLTPHRLGRKFKRIASHVRDAMAKAVDVDED